MSEKTILIPGFLQKKERRKSRLSGKEVKIAYDILVELYGEKCEDCEKSPPFVPLQVEHEKPKNKDGYLHHWENLRLRCPSCNSRKNPRGKGKRQKEKAVDSVRVGERVNVGNELRRPMPSSAEMERNMNGEPLFRKYVRELMRDKMRILWSQAVAAGAEEAGVSIVTADRYLSKMCSINPKSEFNKIEDKGVQPVKIYLEWKPENNPWRDQINLYENDE